MRESLGEPDAEWSIQTYEITREGVTLDATSGGKVVITNRTQGAPLHPTSNKPDSGNAR